MPPVRVTVKSRLPEFRGLNLNQAPIEPDITWAAFFQFHPEVEFNPVVHGIASTRNNAFAQDTIQQTSNLFKRNSIVVNIIRVDQANVPSPRSQRNSARSERSRSGRRGTNANGRSRIRIIRPPDIEYPVVMPTTSKNQRNEELLLPTPSASRGQRIGTRRPATVTMNGHGQRQRQMPQNPLQIFPEDLDDENDDGLAHLNYAPSMASEDSQETEVIGNHTDNTNFSILKHRVLTQIGKVPNADFDQMFRELKHLADGDQKYRWSRKAPMVGNMMFQAFAI